MAFGRLVIACHRTFSKHYALASTRVTLFQFRHLTRLSEACSSWNIRSCGRSFSTGNDVVLIIQNQRAWSSVFPSLLNFNHEKIISKKFVSASINLIKWYHQFSHTKLLNNFSGRSLHDCAAVFFLRRNDWFRLPSDQMKTAARSGSFPTSLSTSP